MPPEQESSSLTSTTTNHDHYGHSNENNNNNHDDQSSSSCEQPMKSLFDASSESSACGVGFIVDSRARVSHDLLVKAQVMSSRMEHRGACSCDNMTGDGAGVMTSMPVKLFQKKLDQVGASFDLAANPWASGLIFLKESSASQAQDVFESCARKLGLKVLCWTKPKTDDSCLGCVALASQPLIKQVFVIQSEEATEEEPIKLNNEEEVSFEEKVFFLR